MAKIMLKDLYPYTQISQLDSSVWEMLIEEVKKYTDPIVEIDTGNIILENPMGTPAFMKLMNDSRVHLIVHNNTKLVKNLKVYMMARGEDTERIKHDNFVEGFLKNIQVDGNEILLKIDSVVSQISTVDVVAS